MVVARCHQRNAVAEPDAFGALRAGREEHLGRRGMRILLEKVMLDLPDVIDADPVGELHLFHGRAVARRHRPSRRAAAGARRRYRNSSRCSRAMSNCYAVVHLGEQPSLMIHGGLSSHVADPVNNLCGNHTQSRGVRGFAGDIGSAGGARHPRSVGSRSRALFGGARHQAEVT